MADPVGNLEICGEHRIRAILEFEADTAGKSQYARTCRTRSLAVLEVFDEKNTEIESLRSQIASLEYELTEAKVEIGHHHADFQRIDKAFETWKGNDHDICRVIRGIVE